MPKLLVVDNERYVRRALKDALGKCGYDVIEAANGQSALETAFQENIDGILLDVEMPVMDGWQVLTQVREDPRTQTLPVIMLTSFPSVETESTGIRLGASHLIPKPWHPETLAITVRVALRESQHSAMATPPAPVAGQPPPATGRRAPGSQKAIGTGGKLIPLEQLLSGGIPLESLTLIEGASAAGKSVLCQYLIYGAIVDDRSVALFTTEHTTDSLVQKMSAIGLDLSDHLQGGNLGIYPIQKPTLDDDPETMVAALASEIERVPQDHGFIIVDGITNLAQICQDRAVLGFFSSCQQLCGEGRTIVVVARSSAFDPRLLARLNGLCNSHISIGTEKIGERLVNMLEVRKLSNAEVKANNKFSFQVEPEVGITSLPMARVNL